jgi:protein gp37
VLRSLTTFAQEMVMENSKIEWTDHTFNPWIGCTRVSPGCAHCYAETLMDKRHHRVVWGKGQPRSRTQTWGEPLRWHRAALRQGTRPKVFCASLADYLDDEVPAAWRAELFDLIEHCHALDWLLLSKRPENAFDLWPDHWLLGGAPAHVWAGVSVEDQTWADRRRKHFEDLPALTKFVSYEPALGPVDWQGWEFIDWMIVGGESGAGARRFESAWARETLDWCRAGGVAFFMKQKGSNADVTCRGKGDDPREWPVWCRVREFPHRARPAVEV